MRPWIVRWKQRHGEGNEGSCQRTRRPPATAASRPPLKKRCSEKASGMGKSVGIVPELEPQEKGTSPQGSPAPAISGWVRAGQSGLPARATKIPRVGPDSLVDLACKGEPEGNTFAADVWRRVRWKTSVQVLIRFTAIRESCVSNCGSLPERRLPWPQRPRRRAGW